MITVNDNSVQQINAALLRLESGVTQGLGSQIKNVNVKLSTDIDALKKRLSEIDIGTMVYSAGNHISISSNGVISVTGLARVAETGSYNDLLNTPTIPAAQIQSDWDQADTDALDYIKNKPTIGNARINIYENGLASESFTVNQTNDQTIKLSSNYSLYFCETNSYTQVKTCRLISGAGLFNGTTNREASAIIYFKYLNWRADAVLTFNDDPSSTQYNPGAYNPTGIGSYRTNNGRYAFGYGLYIVTHSFSSYTSYVYLQALDSYSRAICTYATQPTTSAEFETSPAYMVFYSIHSQAGVNETTDGSFLCYFPKCLLYNDTWFRNINGNDGNSGSRRYGTFNNVALTSAGKLLTSALYRVQVGKNSSNWSAYDIYTINYSPGYTYVVDSDDALAAWINNTAGNDYTHVLIKKGTWTGSGNINVTTTGTMTIVGEPGSVLNLSGYITRTGTAYVEDMRIENVTINRIASGGTYTIAFRYLSNLLNCRAIISVDANTLVYGYEKCHRIVNCTAECTNANSGTRSTYGFYGSDYLVNCRALAYRTNIGTTNMSSCGFGYCNYVTNCYSEAYTKASGTSGEGQGYNNCTYLEGCSSKTSANSTSGGGRGYINCNHVVNCCTLAPDSSYTNKGIDFYNSYSVHNCRAGSGASESYRTVYASCSPDSTYAAADTPNGGFNA